MMKFFLKYHDIHLAEQHQRVPAVKSLVAGMCLFFLNVMAQNTATASGNWSACATWGNPPAIYRNTTDTKTISSGVTVMADAAWSTAAIALNGNGSVNYNSGIFTDFVNDQGADAECDAVYTALQSTGCTSCPAYNAAGAGQYVPVTAADYNAIKSRLAAITAAGSGDGQLTFSSGWLAGTGDTRSIAVSQPKAPAGSYIVAFAVAANTAAASANIAIKLKYNTTASPASGYADYGSGYAYIHHPSNGIFYFVMKKPAPQTYGGGDSYLAYYADNPGIKLEGNDNFYRAYMADSNTLTLVTAPDNQRSCIQILTTTVKQW